MIQLKNLKTYSVFLAICGLFLVALLACGIIYLQYVKELKQEEIKEQEMSLEIKLPIIEWGKYEALSKHYMNGNIQSSN
jgi:hypothetical protein